MAGREIIRKVIEFDSPPTIGLDFNKPHPKDIAVILSARLSNSRYEHLYEWGYYDEVLKEVPGFGGEVRRDCFGNIYGRLEGRTKGECIKGALQDGWEVFDSYALPGYDASYEGELRGSIKRNEGKFLLGALPVGVFSTIRDLRRIDNIFSDLILEENMVIRLLEEVEKLAAELIKKAAVSGFDGVVVYDDWGIQNSLMINPVLWRKIFKPVYKRLVEITHGLKMKFFLHSCGYVYDIIDDFIAAGIDVLQFDQPELVGVERLSEEFGGRVTFWCPVDIQKIMTTGNRELIRNEASKMIKYFGRFKGGFIAKDYPSWEDIDVKDEWAQWAREVFISQGKY